MFSLLSGLTVEGSLLGELVAAYQKSFIFFHSINSSPWKNIAIRRFVSVTASWTVREFQPVGFSLSVKRLRGAVE